MRIVSFFAEQFFRIWALTFISVCGVSVGAQMPKNNFVSLSGFPLVVTHPTAKHDFDTRRSAQETINKAIRLFARYQQQRVYLYYQNPDELYVEDPGSGIYLRSYGGEYNHEWNGNHIALAGGFLGYSRKRGCLTSTIADTIRAYFKIPRQVPPHLHLLGTGIYYSWQQTPQEIIPKFQRTRKAWIKLLFDSHEAHFAKYTTIGGGILPELEEGQGGYWNFGQVIDQKEYELLESTARPHWHWFDGRVNDVRIENYTFRFHYNERYVAEYGKGDKVVNFHYWGNFQSFSTFFQRSFTDCGEILPSFLE